MTKTKANVRKILAGLTLTTSLLGGKMASAEEVQTETYEPKISQTSDKTWDQIYAEHEKLSPISRVSQADKDNAIRAKKEIENAKKLLKRCLDGLDSCYNDRGDFKEMTIKPYEDYSVGKYKVESPMEVSASRDKSVFDDREGSATTYIGYMSDGKDKFAEKEFYVIEKNQWHPRGNPTRIIKIQRNGDVLINCGDVTIRGNLLNFGTDLYSYSISELREIETGPGYQWTTGYSESWGDVGETTKITHEKRSYDGKKVLSKDAASYKGRLPKTSLTPQKGKGSVEM